METRGAASILRLSLGGVIAWFYFHPQFYEYHYVFDTPWGKPLQVVPAGTTSNSTAALVPHNLFYYYYFFIFYFFYKRGNSQLGTCVGDTTDFLGNPTDRYTKPGIPGFAAVKS